MIRLPDEVLVNTRAVPADTFPDGNRLLNSIKASMIFFHVWSVIFIKRYEITLVYPLLFFRVWFSLQFVCQHFGKPVSEMLTICVPSGL
jgi:hypothetical protein